MTRLSLIAGLLAATALPAGAVSFSIDGGSSATLPGNYSLSTGGSSGDSVTRFDAAAGGAIGGGLKLDGPAEVSFEYLGTEAAYDNVTFTSPRGSGPELDNKTSAIGDTISVIDDGGFVDFGFATNGGSGASDTSILNGGTSDSGDIYLAFSDISEDGNSAVAYFGDGAGDNDYEDMVVGVTASPVPLPAAAPLLLGALGGLGFAGRRRMRRA